MGHNPPVYEWTRGSRSSFPNLLMVSRRQVGGEVAICEEDGIWFYVGLLHGVLLPGRHDGIDDARTAVEEAYRNYRWPALR